MKHLFIVLAVLLTINCSGQNFGYNAIDSLGFVYLRDTLEATVSKHDYITFSNYVDSSFIITEFFMIQDTSGNMICFYPNGDIRVFFSGLKIKIHFTGDLDYIEKEDERTYYGKAFEALYKEKIR